MAGFAAKGRRSVGSVVRRVCLVSVSVPQSAPFHVYIHVGLLFSFRFSLSCSRPFSASLPALSLALPLSPSLSGHDSMNAVRSSQVLVSVSQPFKITLSSSPPSLHSSMGAVALTPLCLFSPSPSLFILHSVFFNECRPDFPQVPRNATHAHDGAAGAGTACRVSLCYGLGRGSGDALDPCTCLAG